MEAHDWGLVGHMRKSGRGQLSSSTQAFTTSPPLSRALSEPKQLGILHTTPLPRWLGLLDGCFITLMKLWQTTICQEYLKNMRT